MNKYEVVYIIDPAVEEEARKELMSGASVAWPMPSIIRPKAIMCW